MTLSKNAYTKFYARPQILKFTGGKQVLTVSQVREFTGMVDSRTIRRHFPIMKGGYISAATLARCLCGSIKK